ncbi:MAG: hypothetical protein CVV49_02475 [Spirochaetae bacterium HGW-Spirochaetae-5]|nr:MAG: hypothetical protein CVV49_02475 [Spirochaetae bacterium HGW-Spirochaetae-5]
MFKKKVIVKISGGLGNQLFQYSIGRMLSIKNGAPLYLDISFFKNDKFYDRIFLLEQFNIKADSIFSEAYEQKGINLINRFIKYYKKIEKTLNKFNKHFVDEPFFLEDEYSSHLNYLSGNPYNKFLNKIFYNKYKYIVLNGYWQSEKYFKSIEHIIRDDLEIIQPIPLEKKTIESNLRSTNSVCIGVRQYTDSPASANHFKLDVNYYNKAMDDISKKIDSPKFYVFTLEKDWVKDNITGYPLTIIEPSITNETAYIDLYLMTQCKHFIIANSTFHWWGAWLADNDNKIVIAPSKGWGNECAIPDVWIKI